MNYVCEKHFHWKLIIPFVLDKQVALKMQFQVQCACRPGQDCDENGLIHIVYEVCQLSSMMINQSYHSGFV